MYSVFKNFSPEKMSHLLSLSIILAPLRIIHLNMSLQLNKSYQLAQFHHLKLFQIDIRIHIIVRLVKIVDGGIDGFLGGLDMAT